MEEEEAGGCTVILVDGLFVSLCMGIEKLFAAGGGVVVAAVVVSAGVSGLCFASLVCRGR